MRNFRIRTALLAVPPLLAACALTLYLAGVIPYRVFVVHTGSMSPTIPSRSAVVVHEGSYRVGQTITFRVHGTVVTHRLIAIDVDGRLHTKGDANRSPDPWTVGRADVVGGVVLAPHFAGFALVYARTLPGALSLVLAVLALWQAAALAPRRAEEPSVVPAA